MATTEDPRDPGLQRVDPLSKLQEKHLVLSEAERKAGYARPVFREYVHETCRAVTTIAWPIAQTYAARPDFYTSTYCANCRDYFPVGPNGEFIWLDRGTATGLKVGT